MKKLEIIDADFSNPEHASAILHITDNYARDAMGLEKPLPVSIKGRLIEEFKKFPCSLSILAFFDGEPAGVVNCFYGFSTFNAARLINIHDPCGKSKIQRQGHRQGAFNGRREKSTAGILLQSNS